MGEVAEIVTCKNTVVTLAMNTNCTRQTDRTDRLMLRRKSEPCGQTEDFQKMEEKTSERMRKKERRKSESNMDEEDRKDRKKTEMGRGKLDYF